MRRPEVHGWLTLAWLVLWMVPGASALAVRAHVALDHHGGRPVAAREAHVLAGPHGSDDRHEHGSGHADGEHEHTVTVPVHRHRATLEGPARIRPSATVTPAAVPAGGGTVRDPWNQYECARRPRARSPDPLFYAHCSLLL